MSKDLDLAPALLKRITRRQYTLYKEDKRMARVIDTDNFGGDYPNESFVTGILSEEEARTIADAFNDISHDLCPRYYRVVADDYKLVPSFEP